MRPIPSSWASQGPCRDRLACDLRRSVGVRADPGHDRLFAGGRSAHIRNLPRQSGIQDAEWRFRYWHNDTNFYDLFGPVDRSLRGDGGKIEFKRPLITICRANSTSRRALPTTQASISYRACRTFRPKSTRNIVSADVEAQIRKPDRSRLGAVDHEEGWGWNVDASQDYAAHEVFPKIRAGLDFGYALDFWRHSLFGFTARPVRRAAITSIR